MQAIVTKYLPATETKPARVKALCEAGNIALSWDSGLDTDQNHRKAALALVQKLGWDKPCYGGKLVQGSLPRYSKHHEVFVFIGRSEGNVVMLQASNEGEPDDA